MDAEAPDIPTAPMWLSTVVSRQGIMIHQPLGGAQGPGASTRWLHVVQVFVNLSRADK